MSGKPRERQGYGDEQSPEEGLRAEEAYQSPRVDDIPLDRPATTEPGLLQANLGGSPGTDD